MDASSLSQLDKKRNILKWVFFALAIGWSLFLIINGAIQGTASAQESNTISKIEADVINTVAPGTITPETFPQFAAINRKVVGHFLAFTLDAVFATISIYYFTITRKWYKFYYMLLISTGFGLIVALISEFLQLFTNGRVASFGDVGIDMLGYALGLLIIFLILLFSKKLNPNPKVLLAN